MGACYEHLTYVERLAIDEGRRARLSLREWAVRDWVAVMELTGR